MPTLDWIGKDAVVNHHRQVAYRLLRCDRELSAGDPDAGNLLVQGDNLLALKALLPYYAGKVKCIYIDPPYNTGNEGWVYNDNVNSPEIRKWLGDTVGKEAEDLSRHDKWLCMMYPRLAVLKEFLREDGAIFVSIDDHEVHNLRLLMDEIFGPRNFVASIIWQKIFSTKNTARHLSESHDYIILYAKDAERWTPNLITRAESHDKRYKNPDNDPRGPWTSGDCSARNPYNAGIYPITCPGGREIPGPPKGMYWRFSKERFEELDRDGRIWWGKGGNNVPRVKRFLTEVKQGVVPDTIWLHKEVGNTQEAKKELLAACDFEDSRSVFISPKPTRLLKRILEIATDKDSLILDSFAGSASTGHAVLNLNKADGGTRRFIQVEMDENVCRGVAAQRLQRVVEGYERTNDDKVTDVEGAGGGFRYCKLGNPLFDEFGNICESVKFTDLAAHVFFTETGVPIPKRARRDCPLLGVHEGKAVYLLFNGVLGDKRPNGGNVLTHKLLDALPEPPSPDPSLRGRGVGPSGPSLEGRGVEKVIYGEACRIGADRLKALGVRFKQVPYEIKVD